MEKIKIMIIDSKEEREEYEKGVSEIEGLELVAYAPDGENAVELAINTNPDIILTEVILPTLDGYELFSKIKPEVPRCKFFAISALNTPMYVNKAINMGFDYYMIKPISFDVVAKRIFDYFIVEEKGVKNNELSLEEKITNIFITVGIPAHIKGYQFLREAIKMTVHDPKIINNITKKLYPSIADIYDTSASKVERAIRHAIEVAWNKGKIENINDVFGLKVYDTNEKPTNGEFIALVADKMLLEV